MVVAIEFFVMKTARTGLVGFSIALLSAVNPSQAFAMGMQEVGGFNFSTSGASVNNSAIPITPFSAADASKLTAVKIYFKPTLPTFGGQARLMADGDPTDFANTGKLTFNFTSGSGALTTTPSSITLNPSNASANTTATANGNFTGVAIGSITTNTGLLQSYFSGAPMIGDYFATYASSSTPDGGSVNNNGKSTGTGQYLPTTLGGQFYVQYEYAQDVSSVPGPLPLLGAAAAFGYSRQIRRKIKASV